MTPPVPSPPQVPTFTKPLRNVETMEGTNVHLECRLRPVGDNSMKVEWFVNDQPLKVGEFVSRQMREPLKFESRPPRPTPPGAELSDRSRKEWELERINLIREIYGSFLFECSFGITAGIIYSRL